MGRAVNLSPLGLYNWDSTIFDLMQIPEELDKDTLVDNLLAETAELEVLYPNPVVFKNLVGVWSQKQIDIWNKLYATTQYEYNPIENYNRYETGSDSGTGRTTHSGTDTTTENTTHGGRDTRTIDRDMGGSDSSSGNGKDEHYVAGFNPNTPSGDDDGLLKQTRDETESTSTTRYGSTEDVTDTLAHGETIAKTGGLTHGEQVATTNEGEHEIHAHGNIGVTTTQKLIREQRDIDLFNLYDIIIEDFKMRFCILVY